MVFPGMEILHTAEFDSPVGMMRLASTDRGLAYLSLPNASGRGFAGWLERHSPRAHLIDGYAANRLAISQVREFLEGKRAEFDLQLDLRATEFQLAVYREVVKVGYGETCSYGEVAARVGRPKAVRAVGAANGANPIPLVIPCHRIVAKGGHLQGYAGGLPLKARLLAMESARPSQGRLL